MNMKQIIATVAVAGGLGAGVVGLGAGVASADPHHFGNGPGYNDHHDDHHDRGYRPDIRPEDRDGYYRAVHDHRPFQYQGRWVNPVFDIGHQAWGFWLGPIWIPLV